MTTPPVCKRSLLAHEQRKRPRATGKMNRRGFLPLVRWEYGRLVCYERPEDMPPLGPEAVAKRAPAVGSAKRTPELRAYLQRCRAASK